MGGGVSLPVVGGNTIAGKLLNTVGWAIPGINMLSAANAVDRTLNDPGGAKNAASNAQTQMSQAQANQQAQAASLQQTLLSQPQVITPDNFLATKAAQLANLRMGIASTITGAGGSPSPVLGSTSLTGSYPGKTKYGQ